MIQSSKGINLLFSAPGEAGRPKKNSVVVILLLHWSNAAFSSVALRFYSDRNCCNIASRCGRKAQLKTLHLYTRQQKGTLRGDFRSRYRPEKPGRFEAMRDHMHEMDI